VLKGHERYNNFIYYYICCCSGELVAFYQIFNSLCFILNNDPLVQLTANIFKLMIEIIIHSYICYLLLKEFLLEYLEFAIHQIIFNWDNFKKKDLK
jgi:hypothetical protein